MKKITDVDLRTDDLATAVGAMRLAIIRQDRLIATMRKRILLANKRVAAVLHNQNHYLRHRAPAVINRGKNLIKQSKILMKKLSKLPSLRVHTKTRTNRHNFVFLCTGNEARKLRALAEMDMRRFNTNGKLRRRFPALNYNHRRTAK